MEEVVFDQSGVVVGHWVGELDVWAVRSVAVIVRGVGVIVRGVAVIVSLEVVGAILGAEEEESY